MPRSWTKVPRLPGAKIMMIFSCMECNQRVIGADHETMDQILDRVEEHVRQCPMATFTFEGITNYARQRADELRANLREYHRAWIMRLH